MSSALYHSSDPDLDSAYNDTLEQVLPYTGGDIANTELGFHHDKFAEMNEPVHHVANSRFYEPCHEHLSWSQEGYRGMTEHSLQSASVTTDHIFEDSLFQHYIAHQATDGHILHAVPEPTSSTNLRSQAFSQVDCPIDESSLQSVWSGTSPDFTRTDAECQLEPYLYPNNDHSYSYQGHNGDIASLRSSDPSSMPPECINDYLLSPALNHGAPMERDCSSGSHTSVASRLTQSSTISSSSREQTTLWCPRCNTSFTGRYCRRNRTRHLQTTHAEVSSPYRCAEPNCSRTYKRSDALRVHQGRAHPGVYPPRRPRPRHVRKDA